MGLPKERARPQYHTHEPSKAYGFQSAWLATPGNRVLDSMGRPYKPAGLMSLTPSPSSLFLQGISLYAYEIKINY